MFPIHPKRLISGGIVTFCFLLSVLTFSPSAWAPASADTVRSVTSQAPLVVIDAGHGGSDPGKVGACGTLEKDLNLTLALLLEKLLKAQDIRVLLTRTSDIELGEDPSNRKLSDLMKRVRFIEDNKPDAVISIHQNSYTSPDIYGAQCFYYTGSENGQLLAGLIQKRILHSTNQTKVREIKPNSDYYLLKNSPSPTVIVECGFLSNPQEEELLNTPVYQRKMAWAIHLGLLEYLNQQS